MNNSKLFEKITLNKKVEVPYRLAIPPLTLFGSNEDETRRTNIGLYILGALL